MNTRHRPQVRVHLVAWLAAAGLLAASQGASAAYSTGISYLINAQTGFCLTQFQTVDSNQAHALSGTPTIHIVKNRNSVNATCRFIDFTERSGDRGESITEATCTIIEADGATHTGLGHGTSGNNDAGAPGTANGFGSTIIKCKAGA